MSQIDAIYQGGVFKPLEPIALTENEQVRLSIQRIPAADLLGWLEQAQQFRQRLFARYGTFPDSAPEIAADRGRDE